MGHSPPLYVITHTHKRRRRVQFGVINYKVTQRQDENYSRQQYNYVPEALTAKHVFSHVVVAHVSDLRYEPMITLHFEHGNQL